MSEPRWIRERRRWVKACNRYPRRIVLPMLPHEKAAADFAAEMFGRIWTIPEPVRVEPLDVRQSRSKPVVAHGGRKRPKGPQNATSRRSEGN